MTSPLEKTIQDTSNAFEGVFRAQEAERERLQKETQERTKAPPPLTYGDVLQKDFEGLPWNEIRRQREIVGWDVQRYIVEKKTDGWRERWAQALTENTAKRAEERTQKRIADALDGGPVGLATWSVERLVALVKNQKLRDIANTYELARGGLLILGPTGIGKSVSVLAALRRLVYARELEIVGAPREDDDNFHTSGWVIGRSYTSASEAWIRAFDLPNARLQHGLGDGEAELVQLAMKSKLLVLDDMGWESRRAGADDVVSEVIGRRYDNGLVTIVTSGQRLDAFTERYGDAVLRRIVESGGLPGKVIDAWPKEKS